MSSFRSEMAVNLVNVESVSKVYGTRALLDEVSLGVSGGTGSGSSGATATARPP
jgi:ATP-binding cassette subfamily F protein uup